MFLKISKLGLGRKLICTVANEFIRLWSKFYVTFGDAWNISIYFTKMGAEKLYAFELENFTGVMVGEILSFQIISGMFNDCKR